MTKTTVQKLKELINLYYQYNKCTPTVAYVGKNVLSKLREEYKNGKNGDIINSITDSDSNVEKFFVTFEEYDFDPNYMWVA